MLRKKVDLGSQTSKRTDKAEESIKNEIITMTKLTKHPNVVKL